MKRIITIMCILGLSALYMTSCVDPTHPEFEEGDPVILKTDSSVKVVKDKLTIYGTNLFREFKKGSTKASEPYNQTIYFVENVDFSQEWYTYDTSAVISAYVEIENSEIWSNNKIVVTIPDSTSINVEAICVSITYKPKDPEIDEIMSLSKYYPIKIRKTDEIETVAIPAGSFVMGSEFGNYDESPAHKVNLTKNMLFGKYEINQRIYTQVADTNPSKFVGDYLPVNNVTYEEAITFCNKLSELEGYTPVYDIKENSLEIIPDANGWRLPTEAEWEYSCRAGSDTDYPFTSEEDANKYAWYNLSSGFQPHSCGQLAPNDFGLYDMVGNVYEWCWDYKDAYSADEQTDPIGSVNGETHVLRGGSFIDGKFYLRSSNRKFSNDMTTVGFRILRYEE